MLHQELQRLDITDDIKHNYSRNILNGDLDSVLVVLFASTERIEILRVASTKLRLKGLLDVFDPDVAGLYFNLKHLNLSFVSEGPELEFFEIGDIMHLFFLPFLEHLGVTHCIGEPSHLSGLELSLGKINLSSISLVDSCMDKDTLESILNASRYVKSFKYTACPLLNEELESVPVNGDDIMQALQFHKNNLEILHIELDDIDLEIDDQNRHTKLDHFASFSNLQHLHTEQSCLSTSPKLPESLKELILENCDEPIFELVVFLVKERKTRLKRLGVVYIQPLWSPCTSVLDIFPQFNKKELYDNEVYRERFKDSVEELVSIALDGVGLLLFIACECYQECVRMLNREMGLFREDEESS
ncbi:uncharacterized protein ASPGLDRAFT_43078 [Aspergillus glaucus CBS 516.65]|uniref:F-box domain-containing protein n=1 Tax=Aspergillus glaucus CBS 516.65 TaxID=1160497 RepID=A0A1L9VVS2_ASPGL|nr:hypothetical protein ASPGLDRAFT_43078 [Aspergillus glaucus CBS 516.65]OJJ87987.1 hypothetical protein ASPGLDRAFT_43078 [Aspergillus glaucus CBS 516.65]